VSGRLGEPAEAGGEVCKEGEGGERGEGARVGKGAGGRRELERGLESLTLALALAVEKEIVTAEEARRVWGRFAEGVDEGGGGEVVAG
jgi:hypothetical protein